MDIDIESPVISADGENVGAVVLVIFDPDTNEASHLVISGGLLQRDVVAPISEVVRADNLGVFLNLTAGEVQRLPDFVERDFALPAEEWETAAGRGAQIGPFPFPEYTTPPGAPADVSGPRRARYNIPVGSFTVREGMPVDCDDGQVGVVDRVLVDEYTNAITAFVVRHGTVLARDVTVPMEWVHSLTDGHVRLSCRIDEVEDLPESPASYD